MASEPTKTERPRGWDSEDFAAERKESKARRSRNRSRGAARLDSDGIPYDSKNAGAHLIVQPGADVVDYWPGTGLWTFRLDGHEGRGIVRLVAAVRRRNRRAAAFGGTR